MKLFYRYMALFGAGTCALTSIILLISVFQKAPAQERALRGIETAVWWIATLVACGNLDRRELAQKR